MMTLAELIEQFRRTADDTVEPHLWPDDELIDYANEAVREAAVRAHLLSETAASTVTELGAYAGEAWVALDPVVLTVESVHLSDCNRALTALYRDRLANGRPGWESHCGTPSGYLIDTDCANARLRLYPIPVADHDLELTVRRLPCEPMAAMTDCPAIPARWHRRLVDWMLYRAYQMAEPDTTDLRRAEYYHGKFTESFGIVESAYVQRQRLERRAVVVQGIQF